MQKLSSIQKAIIKEFSKRSGISVEFGIDKIKIWAEVHGFAFNPKTVGGGCGITRGNECVFYCPENMSKSRQELAYVTSMLFHEMAHATSHKNRVPRQFCDSTGHMEEVLAEMTAKNLSIHLNLSTYKSKRLHDAYIKEWGSWLSKDEMYICKEYAELCADYILNNWLVDFNRRGVAA